MEPTMIAIHVIRAESYMFGAHKIHTQGCVAHVDEMTGNDFCAVTVCICLDSGPERALSDMILKEIHIMSQVTQVY